MSRATAIKKHEEALRRAELDADSASLKRAIDRRLVLDGQRVKRAPYIDSLLRRGCTAITAHDTAVITHGDVAVVAGIWHYDAPGSSAAFQVTRVWQKRHGTWRIIAANMQAPAAR